MNTELNINKKFRFREFEVYKLALNVGIEIKQSARKKFPKEEVFALLSQISRAIDSIALNIAEGSQRSTDKDFALFLTHALASTNEVFACIDIGVLNKYWGQTEADIFIEKLALLGNQITAFRSVLLKVKR